MGDTTDPIPQGAAPEVATSPRDSISGEARGGRSNNDKSGVGLWMSDVTSCDGKQAREPSKRAALCHQQGWVDLKVHQLGRAGSMAKCTISLLIEVMKHQG